jgi:membrane protease YdiL (CAAX protease family)
MSRSGVSSCSITDLVVVTCICFGWFILASIQAVIAGFPTRPFTNASFYSIIAVEMIFSATAITYLRTREFDLSSLIPSPSVFGCLVGCLLYVGSVLASFASGALIVNQAEIQPIEEMVENSSVAFVPLVALSVVNGLYEEVFLVGYLQRALVQYGRLFSVGAVVLVRMLYHLYQGPAGAMSVVIFGFIVSAYYLHTRKLWPVVFAHMAADFVGFFQT